jgi:hypothetical protein
MSRPLPDSGGGMAGAQQVPRPEQGAHSCVEEGCTRHPHAQRLEFV